MLKHPSKIFEASSFEMSSPFGHTSRHNSVLGGVIPTPLVATESRKHVASSENAFEGTSEMNGASDTSDREGKKAGVSVRCPILSACGSAPERVGVDGVEEWSHFLPTLGHN